VAALARYWTRVDLVRDPRSWHPSRLFLRCHGRSVEVRTRLVEAEREQLAAILQALIGPPALLPGSASSAVSSRGRAGAPLSGCRQGGAQAVTRSRFCAGREITTKGV
jgi:hypothetical protein